VAGGELISCELWGYQDFSGGRASIPVFSLFLWWNYSVQKNCWHVIENSFMTGRCRRCPHSWCDFGAAGSSCWLLGSAAAWQLPRPQSEGSIIPHCPSSFL